MQVVRLRFLDPQGRPKKGQPVEATMTKIPVATTWTDSEGWATFFAPRGVILYVDIAGRRVLSLMNVHCDVRRVVHCPV